MLCPSSLKKLEVHPMTCSVLGKNYVTKLPHVFQGGAHVQGQKWVRRSKKGEGNEGRDEIKLAGAGEQERAGGVASVR